MQSSFARITGGVAIAVGDPRRKPSKATLLLANVTATGVEWVVNQLVPGAGTTRSTAATTAAARSAAGGGGGGGDAGGAAAGSAGAGAESASAGGRSAAGPAAAAAAAAAESTATEERSAAGPAAGPAAAAAASGAASGTGAGVNGTVTVGLWKLAGEVWVDGVLVPADPGKGGARREFACSMSPQRGSTRFRPLICTYAPCRRPRCCFWRCWRRAGACTGRATRPPSAPLPTSSARVDALAKSRKIPTREILPLFSVSKYLT